VTRLPASPFSTLLAIETSSDRGSVCVFIDGKPPTMLLESSEIGVKCSDWLLPAIDRVLTAANRSLSSLDAIAFGAGPGSFTGVRTACAAAQALAYAHRKPLIAVDVLHALASIASFDAPEVQRVTVALDARMNELYFAEFEKDANGLLQALSPPRLIAANAAPATSAGALLIGSGAALIANTPDPTRALESRWAEGVARLALQRGVAAIVDPLSAEPIYVRNDVAQTEAERAALRRPAAIASVATA
jgi:tRNA threonylcarbamoyladenosine biosynthesis protein TsaB